MATLSELSESAFVQLAEHTLSQIEQAVEGACDTYALDLECTRQGNVLEIECIDGNNAKRAGSKLIVNSNTSLQEIWLAARAGGFHFKRVGDAWRNTRDNSELFSSLAQQLSAQCGVSIQLKI